MTWVEELAQLGDKKIEYYKTVIDLLRVRWLAKTSLQDTLDVAFGDELGKLLTAPKNKFDELFMNGVDATDVTDAERVIIMNLFRT